MDEVTALHTAARRYCLDEFSHWRKQYLALVVEGRERVPRPGSPGWGYSQEAYATFPRYRVVEAILAGVEGIVPSHFASAKEVRATLSALAQPTYERPARELKNPTARSAMAEGIERFPSFIAGLTQVDLALVRPLPIAEPSVRKKAGVYGKISPSAGNSTASPGSP